jgi:hypothetical protein
VRIRHYRLHVRAWSGQSSKAGFGACISRSGLCCLILRSASARARLLVGGGRVVGPLSLSLSTLANRSGSDGVLGCRTESLLCHSVLMPSSLLVFRRLRCIGYMLTAIGARAARSKSGVVVHGMPDGASKARPSPHQIYTT